MSKIIVLALAFAVVICVAGCKNPSGSREYTPGVGWKTND